MYGIDPRERGRVIAPPCPATRRRGRRRRGRRAHRRCGCRSPFCICGSLCQRGIGLGLSAELRDAPWPTRASANCLRCSCCISASAPRRRPSAAVHPPMACGRRYVGYLGFSTDAKLGDGLVEAPGVSDRHTPRRHDPPEFTGSRATTYLPSAMAWSSRPRRRSQNTAAADDVGIGGIERECRARCVVRQMRGQGR